MRTDNRCPVLSQEKNIRDCVRNIQCVLALNVMFEKKINTEKIFATTPNLSLFVFDKTWIDNLIYPIKGFRRRQAIYKHLSCFLI